MLLCARYARGLSLLLLFFNVCFSKMVTTLAGGVLAGSNDGVGTAGRFNGPCGVSVDAFDNVYVADSNNNKIRLIFSQNRSVITLAGSITGLQGTTDGVGTGALFFNPFCVAGDTFGNLYVCDSGNNKIRFISSSNRGVTTIAGGNNTGTVAGSNDGVGTAALFNYPYAIAVDTSSNVVYVSDCNNHKIRQIYPNRSVITLAGGSATGVAPGINDGVGTSSLFFNPIGIALDSTGKTMFVADFGNHLIRLIHLHNRSVSTLAGGNATGNTLGSINGVATGALFHNPRDVAVDSSGNVYVADSFNHQIRLIFSNRSVVSLAGGGINGTTSGANDGLGTSALFRNPANIALTSLGNLIVADLNNQKVRLVTIDTFSCPPGTSAPNFTSKTCTLCQPGGYSSVINAPSCSTCSGGTFSDSSGSTSCTPCPSGTFSLAVGASSNATCTPCAANTFTNTSGLTACYPCPPDTYSNPGTGVCLTTAGVCPAGSFCPSGSNTGCPSGWATTSESTYCFKIFLTLQSWANSQSSCRTSDPTGNALGRLASIRSAAEFSLLMAILGTQNYAWIGLYSLPNTCGNSAACTTWVWDQAILSNTFISNNRFWATGEPNGPGTEECVQIVRNTNGMNDGPCALENFYICEIPAQLTVSCPLGAYCPIGSTLPLNCSAGTYSPTLGASKCTPCTNGTYSTTVGAAVCDLSPCLPGYYCPSGSATPRPCPRGSFNSNPGGVSLADCRVCPAGYYTNANTSATDCQPCPETFYCPANTTDPLPCPPGTGFSTNVTRAVDCGTASPTPTNSPTPTMTPTMTPPPRSCLNVPGRCATPSPSAGDLVGVLGVSVPRSPTSLPTVTNDTTVTVSWPALGNSFSITLPLPPSTGEVTNVTCWGAAGTPTSSLPTLTITPVWGEGQVNCSGTLPTSGAACIQFASQDEGVLTPNPPAQFMVYGSGEQITPPPTSFAVAALNTTRRGAITCLLQSLPELTSPLYPRYPLKLPLTIPLNATRLSIPLLAGVLLESGTFGTFRLVGGVGIQGDTFTLPNVLNTNTSTPDCVLPTLSSSTSSSAGGGGTATVSLWTSTSANLFRCISAFDALTSLSLQFSPTFSSSSSSSSTYFPLSASLSGSRHLLLLASSLTPFPPNSLTVTLKGVACTLNWVHPNGLIASVLTPTLGALGCFSGQECGTAPLILSFNNPGPIPGAYPPLQPMPAHLWVAALGALSPFSPLGQQPQQQQQQQQQQDGSVGGDASLPITLGYTGLPTSAIVPLADATTPPSTGINIVAQCTDPSYASPEDCAVVNSTQPYLPPGKVCVWGSGDNCVTCSSGALCPGGTAIYPLAGYWCPLATSPPIDVVPCPSPGALERCPGWPTLQPSTLGVYGCGVGYRGQGCSGCDTGFFPSGGACVTCPKAPLLVSLALPIVYFLLGLGGFGGVIMAVVWATAVYIKGKGGGGGRSGATSGSRVKCTEIAALVGDLCVWIWLSAQGVASLFRQAQSVAPGVLAPFFQAVTSLQFQGITLDPSCYSGIPFQSFWLAVGGVGVGTFVGVAGTLCFSSPSPLLLNLASLILSLGYGAITSIFSSATICTLKAPMSVIDYLNAVHDGGALRAALGPGAPTTLQLKAVLGSPNANPALATIIRSTIPVSVLASDPFQVCNEGPHATVRPVAMAMIALYTAGLPLFGVYLHCLTRARRKAGGGTSSSTKPTTPRPPPLLLSTRATPETTTESPLPPSTFGWGGEEEGEKKEEGDDCATTEEEVKPLTLPSHPRATAVEKALVDATLLPPMQWTQFFEMGALAVITGLTSLAQGAGIQPSIYIACQAGVMGVCLISVWVVGGVRKGWGLYLTNHAWKNPVKASLYGITALSALTCILLFSLPPSSGSNGVRLGLAGLILFVTAGVALLLFVQWWRSLFVSLQISFIASSKPKVETLPPPPPLASTAATEMVVVEEEEEEEEEEGSDDTSNPPTPPPLPRPLYEDTLWRRHRDEDQDIYWWRPSDGAVEWTLEGVDVGDATQCGWEKREGDGRWVHGESGALSDHPPPADEGLCERVLQEGHFHRLVVDSGEILGLDVSSLPPMLVLSPVAIKEREFQELMAHGEEALKGGYVTAAKQQQQQQLMQPQGYSREKDKEFQALVQAQDSLFAGSSMVSRASPSVVSLERVVVGRGRRAGSGDGGNGKRGKEGVNPLYSLPRAATTKSAGDDDFNTLMSHGKGLH